MTNALRWFFERCFGRFLRPPSPLRGSRTDIPNRRTAGACVVDADRGFEVVVLSLPDRCGRGICHFVRGPRPPLTPCTMWSFPASLPPVSRPPEAAATRARGSVGLLLGVRAAGRAALPPPSTCLPSRCSGSECGAVPPDACPPPSDTGLPPSRGGGGIRRVGGRRGGRREAPVPRVGGAGAGDGTSVGVWTRSLGNGGAEGSTRRSSAAMSEWPFGDAKINAV